MPITAAEVESNGWVLRVTVTGSQTVPNTNFAAYVLNPNGLPRVMLSSSHPGFVKSAGTAVSGPMSRALVATRPLRLPVNPASPTVRVLDETDLGGGLIRVRLALAEHVYASDTGLSLAVLAGWRAGEAAASGIAVTNSSTVAAPIPIFRWVLAPYETTAGSFRVSLLVFSHHPVGFEPVAGVKFTATDGATVKTAWTTALDTDNSHGDNLRCYTAIIDPATATALTAGLLRIDAEVYPWLGAMRTTDPAGTRLLTTLRTDGFSVNAASPWVIGYDPARTRYGQQWAFVDPVNGTTTPAAGMVATSLAAAKAVAPASRPRDVNTAVQAGYLVNRTLPAANGLAAQARNIDGMTIVLSAGTHVGGGATSVTTGLTTGEIPVRIVGDPDDGNPRVNCILQSGTSVVGSRVTRIRWQNLTVEQGTTTLSGASTIYNLIDNATFRGKPGQEANSVAPFATAPPAGQWNLAATRSRFWRTGVGLGSGNPKVGLFRGSETTRQLVTVLTAIRNRLIGSAEDGFVGTGTLGAFFSGWQAATLAGQVEDVIIAWNDLRFLRGRAWGPQTLPAATAGTPNPSIRRQVFFGNVCERIGADPSPFFSLGEDASATMTYNIIEANTFAGDRANTFYSDPLPVSLADTDNQLNQAFVNRVANNAFDWFPTKHDDFDDPTTRSVRTAASVASPTGFRPHMVAAWPALFGVGFEGNYDTGRSTGSNFEFMWPGLRSVQNLAGASVSPLYSSDGSIAGPGGAGAAGGGNYLPQAGSPLIGRVVRANSDRDIVGTARQIGSAAGAFEAAVQGAALAPAGARSQHRAAVAALTIAFTVTPALARHLHLAEPTTCGWQVTLVVASARSDTRAEHSAISAQVSGDLLQPDSTLHLIPAGLIIILPDRSGTGADTLKVDFDPRTLSIR